MKKIILSTYLNKILSFNNTNIFQLTFILLTLTFCVLRLLQFWGEFQKFELFVIANGYALFFILSPGYFLYLKNFSVATERFENLVAIVKEYFSNVFSIAMIVSGGLFLLLATHFDFWVLILFIEQFLFTTMLVFAIMLSNKNFSNNLFFIAILAFWQLIHITALNSSESVWKLWLNPLSSWTYLTWYFDSLIYLFPILLKWIMLYPLLRFYIQKSVKKTSTI